jgi:uncharacterized protein
VTQELTHPDRILPAMELDIARAATMPPGATAVLDGPSARTHRPTGDVAARLARFRAAAGRAAPPAYIRPSGPPPGPDRAARLAEALGGDVERTAEGRVVRVVASRLLPVAFERLAALPYPVDPGHPLVCLDTETTGLGTAAGTVAFLVGLGRWDGERFDVIQLVLPDHPDEPAFLAALRAAIPPDAWLVTYNGKGFDWPLLVTRFRLQRSAAPTHAGHLDLLPVARQLWRHRLDDARLATVERGVAGVLRIDDLPGALVPARYLEFLRTGSAEPLRAVVEHNRQDVVSLGLLLAHLVGRLADPASREREPAGDVAALGRAYARRRRFDEALACCDTAVSRAPDERQHEVLAAERARVLRLAGRPRDSANAWLDIATAQGALAAVAWVQFAKYLEHSAGDPASALEATERASALVDRQRALGRDLPRLQHDLARRRERLQRRLAGVSRRPVAPAAAAVSAPGRGPR